MSGVFPLARLLAPTMALLVFASCQPSDRLPTYPVAGRVVLADGSPFHGGDDGAVIWESVEHGLSATGAIDSEGRFTLTTYEPGDGAVAGKHRIAISPPTPEGDPDARVYRPTIDPKFRDLDASGLEATIEPKRLNEITVELTDG